MSRLLYLFVLLFIGASVWLVGPSVYRGVSRHLHPVPVPLTRVEREIRVIEGWNVDEQRDQLNSLDPSWGKKWRDLAGQAGNQGTFDPALRIEFVFLRSLPVSRSLDGYLFPDTYRVWEDEMPQGLLRKQLQTFDERVYVRFKDASLPAPLKNFDEAIILASIIEKEVRSPEARQIVAGLFLRRLKEGMALQSDATLTYITGSKRGRATLAETKLDSPYNSYQHRGLPPSPISSPGLSAVEAVFAPTKTSFRYFLTDEDGKVLYASTLEDHVRNKRKAGY